MIKARKIDEDRSGVCNGCNKWAKKPDLIDVDKDHVLPDGDNEIYEYQIQGREGNGGFVICLCNSCARELFVKLYKQVNKE